MVTIATTLGIAIPAHLVFCHSDWLKMCWVLKNLTDDKGHQAWLSLAKQEFLLAFPQIGSIFCVAREETWCITRWDRGCQVG